MTDKVVKSISFDQKDLDYLKIVADKVGLSGDSSVIRFIITAFREAQKKNLN